MDELGVLPKNVAKHDKEDAYSSAFRVAVIERQLGSLMCM